MTNTTTDRITEIHRRQRDFFQTGATLDIKYRKEMLRKLLNAMEVWEQQLSEALWNDLHKSYEEAYLTELSIVKGEIKTHLKKINRWARREKAHTPVKLFPSQTYIIKEPLGCSLIISPWNYPVQLLLNPLVGAISAGCTAVLKPSPYVPNVSRAIEEMIKDTFDEEYIAIVQGNRDVNSLLLEQKWDLIFFTGSPALAKTVMKAAADNLTPVILELGGKSPCIIDKTADIKTTARRLAWGKTLNSGQTCIAPDYILIHEDVKEDFIKAFGEEIKNLHGEDIETDRHYVRIVNDKAFERITSYLKDGRIAYGGRNSSETRFIEPTLIEDVVLDSPLMTEEIFGPIFPIVTLDDNGKSFIDKVIDFVNSREKPLAFYYFGKESDGWKIIRRTSSGGGCINDVIMHIANENAPFGGVGNSGMGRYHDKESFEAFSHSRTILTTRTWLDLPFRYMPYKMFRIIKKIL